MIRKTALLTGIAGVMLMSAPALAQDATTPAPQAAAPAQPAALQLTPGSDVTGGDGVVLGKLEGARSVAEGQELTVRGADGQLRGVPLGGLKQQGAGVEVALTSADYQALPPITDAAPAPTPAPAAPAAAAPAAAAPATDAMAPDTTEDPASTEPQT